RPYPPDSLEDFEVLPGVSAALVRLKAAGFRLIVATNQPDVGKGTQRREVVEAIHEFVRSTLPVDDVRVCYHVDRDACTCRRPRPGMPLEAAGEWDVDLPSSFMGGDRWRDIECGRAAGCRTIFVQAHYDEKQPARPDATVSSLPEASNFILAERV